MSLQRFRGLSISSTVNASGTLLAAGDIWLRIDCAGIDPLGVTTTPLTAGYAWEYSISRAGDACLVKIAATAGPSIQLFGRGALFWISIYVNSSAPAESALELQPYQAGVGGTSFYTPESLVAPVPLQLRGGTLHVDQNHRLGDLNSDGVVQAVDAYIVEEIASGSYLPTSDWEWYCADVNGDGQVSAADASMILYRAAHDTWPLSAGLSSARGVQNETIPVSLSLGSTQAAPGGTVQITLSAANLSSVAGSDLLITYDPQVIERIEQVETVGAGRLFSLTYKDDGNGRLRIVLASDSGVSGSGDLLRLTVRLKRGAPGGTSTTLALADARLNDLYGRDFATSSLQVSVSKKNGRISIGRFSCFLPLMNK